MVERSGLLDQAGLDCLDRDPDALGPAIGGLDSDALKIGPELALRDARHVRADAAALLRLTLAIDDRALDGTATGDCTDSSHDGFELVKGSEVKVRLRGWQGESWRVNGALRFTSRHAEPEISAPGGRDVKVVAAQVCVR